jgi:hypothetical protein
MYDACDPANLLKRNQTMPTAPQTTERKQPLPPVDADGSLDGAKKRAPPIDADFENIEAYGTLADLMRASPPADGEFVYELTAIRVLSKGKELVWPAEPVFVKAKTPNEARAMLVDADRMKTTQLCKAAVDALREKDGKRTAEGNGSP